MGKEPLPPVEWRDVSTVKLLSAAVLSGLLGVAVLIAVRSLCFA